MRNWHDAYRCRVCGKIYDKPINNLPMYCRCGAEIYEHFRLVDENLFGGYDHVDLKLSDNIEVVVIRKKFFKREIR